MKRSAYFAAALLFGALMARAQEPEALPPPPSQVWVGEPEPGGDVMFAATGGPVELLGFEGDHNGRVVKGAPYTASSESVQTLADGTNIRTSTSNLFRDSQGRSRKETTFSGFGPMAASGKTHTMVSIVDPVAGAHFMLNTETKVAHKMTLRGGGANSNAFPDKIHAHMQQRMQQEEASGQLKVESLGTQTINGVSATGTRYTRTIPEGQIGNDRPLQVVSERWFSSDLQIVVKSTRTDPRFGTTTYSVTNIQKSEPEAALFSVPSDFTIKEGGAVPLHAIGALRRHGEGEVPPPPPNE